MAMRLEWGELATLIGINRTMLHYVRKGERHLSIKALRRLEQAERAAGIATAPSPEPEIITNVSMVREAGEIKKVNISDVRAGIVGVQAALENLLRIIDRLECPEAGGQGGEKPPPKNREYPPGRET